MKPSHIWRKLALLWAAALILVLLSPQSARAQDQKDKDDKDDAPMTATEKEIEAKACPVAKTDHKASTDKTQHPTPDAPADKALVYSVRPTMMGNKVQTKLAVDGRWVGVNRGNNYFFFTLTPGEHYFCSMAENKSVLAMKVEAGKTYYVQQKITMGFMKARNKLVAISAEEGKAALAKSHLALHDPKDDGNASASK
jgi:hypothetical protein